MAKILFVDDDQEIQKMCSAWFATQHVVELASDLGGALSRLDLGFYDIMVIDLGLPDGDGRTLVETCRSRGLATPILVLSGRNEISSKVDLLDLGADDYLTKPFHFKELESRVKSLLRRPPSIQSEVLSAGEIQLNLASAKVTRGGEDIDLTPKELALLEFFMKNQDQTFTQEAIMQRVWQNDSEASPDIVRVYINRLRNKVFVEPVEFSIKNRRGHGYVLTSQDS